MTLRDRSIEATKVAPSRFYRSKRLSSVFFRRTFSLNLFTEVADLVHILRGVNKFYTACFASSVLKNALATKAALSLVPTYKPFLVIEAHDCLLCECSSNTLA